MMTFLSRWFGAGVAANADPAAISGGLRIVRSGDSDVAPPRASSVSVPFVAGQGARIYSLDAFRRAPSGPPRPRAA
jgi:hypothetical protein